MGTVGLHFKSAVSREADVSRAVAACAEAIGRSFRDRPLGALLVYGTVNHDQRALVRAVSDAFPRIPLVGCSTSGVMHNGAFFEDGYLLGMMGLGGEALRAASACAEDIEQDTVAKARVMGQEILAALDGPPRVILLHYDPLCPVDIELYAATLEDMAGCPVAGGGAGQPWGPLVQTHQYFGAGVKGHAAVALALAGDFVVEIGTTTGTSPTGLTMTVTRAEGNVLLAVSYTHLTLPTNREV